MPPPSSAASFLPLFLPSSSGGREREGVGRLLGLGCHHAHHKALAHTTPRERLLSSAAAVRLALPAAAAACHCPPWCRFIKRQPTMFGPSSRGLSVFSASGWLGPEKGFSCLPVTEPLPGLLLSFSFLCLLRPPPACWSRLPQLAALDDGGQPPFMPPPTISSQGTLPGASPSLPGRLDRVGLCLLSAFTAPPPLPACLSVTTPSAE